jgi:hypothetical protein
VRPVEPLRVVNASEEELAAHALLTALLQKSSGGACLWLQLQQDAAPASVSEPAARMHIT